MTLGALFALSDSGQSGFYGSPYSFGTMGYDKYCGKVANSKTVTRNGRRVRVRVKGTHRVCRVPREVYATASCDVRHQLINPPGGAGTSGDGTEH